MPVWLMVLGALFLVVVVVGYVVVEWRSWHAAPSEQTGGTVDRATRPGKDSNPDPGVVGGGLSGGL